MAEDLEKLVIRLSADTRQLREDFRRAQRQTRTATTAMQRGIDRFSREVATSTRRLLNWRTALASAAGTAGLGLLVRNATGAARQLQDTADKVGVNVEALQELRFAAGQYSVAQNTLDLALQRFTRRLGEARQGKGELVAVLQQYNIAVTDAAGRTRATDEVLGDLADTIRGAGSDQERLRLAFKAFDSEGAALVNVLRDGSRGLDELRQRARAAGAVLEADLVRKGAEADRQMALLGASIRTNFQAGVLEGFVGEFGELEQLVTDPEFQAAIRELGTFFGEVAKFSAKGVGLLREGVRNAVENLADYAFGTNVAGNFGPSEPAAGAGGARPRGGRAGGGVVSTANAAKLAEDYKKLREELEFQADVEESLLRATRKGADAVAFHARQVELLTIRRRLEVELTNDQREELAALVDRRREATSAIEVERQAQERATRAREENAEAVRRQIEESKRLAAEAREVALEPLKNAATGIQDAFSDAFASIISEGTSGFESLADHVRNVMTRLAAEVASLLVFRPAVAGGLNAIGLGGVGQSLGLTTNIPGLGVGGNPLLSGAQGLGSLLGFGGGGAALTASQTLALSGPLGGAFAAPGAASAAGLAGSAGGIGSIGLSGALGIAGLAAGGIALVSSLFGGSGPSDKTQVGQIDLASGNIFNLHGLTGSKYSAENARMRDEILRIVQQQARAVGGLTGKLTVAIGSREGPRFSLNGGGDRFYGDQQSLLNAIFEATGIARQARIGELSQQESALRQTLAQRAAALPGQIGLTGLRDFRSSLSFSALSPESPLERLATARGALNDARRAALSGSIDAAKQFPGLAQQVLTIGRDVYASGPGYAALFRTVNAELNQIITRQESLLGPDLMVTIRETSQDQIAAAKRDAEAIQAELRRIRTELSRLRAA